MLRHPRRLATAVVAVAAAAALLTGCSSGGGAASGGDKPTLTVWSRPGSLGKASQQAAQKAFPDYTLKFVPNEAIDDSLRSALRARKGLPDVTFLGGNLPDYFTVANQFLDLGKYAKSSDAYFDFAVKSATAPNGRQIALPTDVAPYVFFYNADEMKKLGLPTEPDAVGKAISDWDAYRAMAEKAKSKGKLLCDSIQGIYELGMIQKGYLYFKVEDGEAKTVIDDPINRTSYDRTAEFAKAGLCGKAAPYSTDWNAQVTQGQVVGFVEPAYVGGILKPAAEKASGQWRIATATPGGPGTESGSFVTAFASTKYPEAAAKLAQYFSRVESQNTAYTTNGLIPSTTASYSDSKVTAPDDFYGGQVAIKAIEQIAKTGPFVFRGPNGQAIQSQFEQDLVNVQSGADADAAYRKTVAALQSQG